MSLMATRTAKSVAGGTTALATPMLQRSMSILVRRGAGQMGALSMKTAAVSCVSYRVDLAIVSGVRVRAANEDFAIGPWSLVDAAFVPLNAVPRLEAIFSNCNKRND